MRRATILGAGKGAHSNADAAVCPACRHPLRLHNAVGCVRGDCECALDRDGLAQPLTDLEPVSAAQLDALDRVCARCGHRRTRHAVLGTGLPCRDCACPSFATEALNAPSAPSGPPAAGEAAPLPAGATARAGFGLNTPRRQNPRPAGHALVLPPAAVGEDDADEEVAAESRATGAAATSVEQAVVAPPVAATALDDVAALVQRALEHAYFIAPRWHCGTCRLWPLDPGACALCGGPLQPVYLATLPREL